MTVTTSTQTTGAEAGAPGASDGGCPVVLPVGRQGRDAVQPVPPLASLDEASILVLDISKVRSDVFADAIQAGLHAAGCAAVERGIAPPSQRLADDELAAMGSAHDGAVLALADCGTCTSWTMFDAIELHRNGCRTVLVTTRALRATVDALAPRLGMADLPVVEVALPNREQTPDEIARTASAAVPAIVAALTS